jgi:hypothetical protein
MGHSRPGAGECAGGSTNGPLALGFWLDRPWIACAQGGETGSGAAQSGGPPRS